MAKDIMETRFTSMPQGTHLGPVEAEMTMANARQVLVLDDRGKLSGIFSRDDLRRAQERGTHGSIAEFMTRRIWTVRAGDDAVKAADLMIRHHVTIVPVVDEEDHPIGLVSDHAFIKMARAHLAGLPVPEAA